MTSGHAAVEILTMSPQQFVAFNAKRYDKLRIEDSQQNEIIAQVGALVKSEHGPLGSIFDGFMPTSYGGTIREIDVPLIQMPTMHEEETNVPRRRTATSPAGSSGFTRWPASAMSTRAITYACIRIHA